MKRRQFVVAVGSLVAFLLGPSPTAAARTVDPESRVAFLPPLGPPPVDSVLLVPGLFPVVQIAELDPVTAAPSRIVVVYHGDAGGSSAAETVRQAGNGHYHVNWHASRFSLETGRTHRISVLLDGQELGHVDVIAAEGGVLHDVRGRPMTTVRSRTVPIKFLIAAPTCAGARPTSCSAAGTCVPLEFAFRSPALLPVGPGPNGVACADFDGDAHADLAVANVYGASIRTWRGAGDGRFHSPATHATGLGPRNIVAVDLNGDARQDLISTNHQDGTVSVLLGNGDGSFASALSFDATTSGGRNTALLVTDLNGDTKLDVVTSNELPGSVSVLLGDGLGSLTAPTSYAVGSSPHGMTSADFDCDGKLDIAVANYGIYGATSDVSILLGTGDGGFLPATSVPAGSAPYSLAAADFDRDGVVDLAVTNYGVVGSPSDVSILMGSGDGTFTPTATITVGAQPYVGVVGDMNNDGAWDIAVSNAEDSTVSIVRGVGDGTFLPAHVVPTGGRGVGLAIADLDDDGRLDIATANGDDDTASVVLNDSF